MWRSVSALLPKRAALLVAMLFTAAVGNHAAADDRTQIAEARLADAAGASAKPSASELDASRAQSLLAAAISAYDAGRADESQIIFEQLVGKFPQAEEAATARRYLSQLYAKLPDGRAKVQKVSEKRPDATGTTAADAVPASSDNARGDEDMIRSERLSAELSNTVGDRIFFSEGGADLGAHARSVLRGQAGWLKRQDVSVKALIAGHADEPLDEEGNKILSARRAEAVRARLIEEGIPPHRVSVIALGRSKPVADCPGSRCAAQNRRAVTIVLERRVEQTQRPGSRSYQVPEHREGPASW